MYESRHSDNVRTDDPGRQHVIDTGDNGKLLKYIPVDDYQRAALLPSSRLVSAAVPSLSTPATATEPQAS
jgi:hypothetical protein